jgi:hypothetical protein
MTRYQIWDKTEAGVWDWIILDEEQFTKHEEARREEARQLFLSCEDRSWCQPNTAYISPTYFGGADETEEEYTESERYYRKFSKIPEGCRPRLTWEQKKIREKLFFCSLFDYGKVDNSSLMEEFGKYERKMTEYKIGDTVTIALEAF